MKRKTKQNSPEGSKPLAQRLTPQVSSGKGDTVEQGVPLPEAKPADITGGSWRQRLSYLYLFVLLPCLIYTVFYTARAVWFDYTPVPITDNWRFVAFLPELLRFDVRHYWLQHNDHRIIFPEMVYALDFILFRGHLWFPAAFNIACQFVQLGLMWWLLTRMQLPRAFQLALGAACALFMTSTMQVVSILGSMLVQWHLSETAAALSFLFLWRSARTGRLSSLVVSVTAAVIATYSSGNGMMLWPVLVMMAALLRLPGRRIAGVAAAGILSISAYFVDYRFLGQGRTWLLLSHPFYAIWFTLVYLGCPASYVNVRLGGLVGLAGLLLVAAAVTIAIRQRRTGDAAFVVAAGVCLFVAGSALMTAYGRMEPGDATVGALHFGRYVSVSLAYWAFLAVLAGWVMMRLPKRRLLGLHLAAASVTAVLLVAVMGRQKIEERAFAVHQASSHEAGIALVAGIEDPDVMRAIYPDPAFPPRYVPSIRDRRLSIFSFGHQDWFGQPVERLFSMGPTSLCSGSLDQLSAVTGGYRATGWAWDRETGRPATDIVLTDPSGMIIGFGETRPGGYPNDTSRPPSNWDWVGFARTLRAPESIQAYAVVQGGKVSCALGTPLPVPHAKMIDAKRVGAAIHIREWKADAAWTRNGFHPSVGTLSGEVLYGSHSGNDANRGVLLSAPFETNGQNCISLPVAHGPSIAGQSVRVVEALSGNIVAAIPLDEMSGVWQYWSVDVRGVPRLRIIAEDNGAGWGQWVAVGEPHWCGQ